MIEAAQLQQRSVKRQDIGLFSIQHSRHQSRSRKTPSQAAPRYVQRRPAAIASALKLLRAANVLYSKHHWLKISFPMQTVFSCFGSKAVLLSPELIVLTVLSVSCPVEIVDSVSSHMRTGKSANQVGRVQQ